MSQSTIILDPKSQIRAKQSLNTYVIKPVLTKNKESIRIEDIRGLLSWAAKTAFADEDRVAIIEDFDKISTNASHALLKLLEEPPQDVQIFILVTQTESLLDTIKSRCSILHSAKLTSSQLANWQLERVQAPTPAIQESWQSFYQFSDVERLQWITTFVKGKKNLSGYLLAWQVELGDLIATTSNEMKLEHIRCLGLIEKSISAATSNVLPRLILNNLAIQLTTVKKH